MKKRIFFISGIDTNIGKTYATGMLARALMDQGENVITQKMIQTGCIELSEDIEKHRQIQGIPLQEEDKSGITCPYLFSYPCSPHMAAAKDGCNIDLAKITTATHQLQEKYDWVLLEGAGGLMVPNDSETLAIDYVKTCGYPLILVTSGKLGSINHTLLSLTVCKNYQIPVQAVVYNLCPETDPLISRNTQDYLQKYLAENFPETSFIILPEYDPEYPASLDITGLYTCNE